MISNYSLNLFNVFFVQDERFLPQDGRSTGISRTCQNEVLVHSENDVDQNTTVEYNRSSSNSRAGKVGELPYSSVARQAVWNQAPGECRQTDAAVSERSIYDNTPEHCYANVEKDERGRLLNRDTLAFRTSDFETEHIAQSNGQDGVPHLVDMSTLHTDRCRDVPVVIHRTHKGTDGICTNSFNHTERTQSDTVASTTDQVPYHTGRSTFYQRVDSTEGTGICVWSQTITL